MLFDIPYSNILQGFLIANSDSPNDFTTNQYVIATSGLKFTALEE